jgi:hypothetical protein
MNTPVLFNIPLLYYFFILAFILPKIPVVGKFFNIINTALHEFGHAIVTLILQGKVHKIELFRDSSGTTTTQCNNKLGSFLVAIAGYPFAATIAYFSFYLISINYEKHLIIGLSLLFIIMAIFWIRNLYGVIWVLLFSGLNFWLIYYNNEQYIQIAALFYAACILTESVSSSLELLYLSIFQPQKAGDATNLKQITHLPAFFWGILFAAFSGFVAYRIVINMLI